jgi:hypothetical protein
VLKGWNYGTERDEARRIIFNGYVETGDNFIDGLVANRLPLGGLFKPSAPWPYPPMSGTSEEAVIKRFLAAAE